MSSNKRLIFRHVDKVAVIIIQSFCIELNCSRCVVKFDRSDPSDLLVPVLDQNDLN